MGLSLLKPSQSKLRLKTSGRSKPEELLTPHKRWELMENAQRRFSSEGNEVLSE